MTIRSFCVVFLFLLLFAFCGYAGEVPKAAADSVDIDAFLTPENIAQLEAGKVVMASHKTKNAEGKSKAQGYALILIKRPFDPIWDQLTHNEQWPEFFPNLASSEKYMDEGNTVGLYECVKAFFMKFRYHAIHVRDKANGTIRFNLDRTKENDVKDTNGSWTVRRHGDNACIAIYSVSVDSGMALPGKIEDFFQNQSLRNVVKALKKRMES